MSKYRRAFIVYIFRRPPEVWSLVSDNASISGTGKASIRVNQLHLALHGVIFRRLKIIYGPSLTTVTFDIYITQQDASFYIPSALCIFRHQI